MGYLALLRFAFYFSIFAFFFRNCIVFFSQAMNFNKLTKNPYHLGMSITR